MIMADNPEAQMPSSPTAYIEDTILKKRGRFRRVNSDPLALTFVPPKDVLTDRTFSTDTTTADLLCCLAATSSTEFEDLKSDSRSNVKSRRLKSQSVDDSAMNLQTCSQDTFVGRYLMADKRSFSDNFGANKNTTLSAEDENYLLSLLPSISVDTMDGSKDPFHYQDVPQIRREMSELSDTADFLKGLSGSYDFTRSRGLSDLMPPPIQLPSHLGSASSALDSGRQADGIAYSFPDSMAPRRNMIKKTSSVFSPARVNTLAKSASMNNAYNNEKIRLMMTKENSLTSAALNEFGMIQVAPNQPSDEVVQSQSVSDISTIPSGSLGSSSTASALAGISNGSSAGGSAEKKVVSSAVQRQNQRASKSLTQIDSASADPSAFDSLLLQLRQQNDSTRSLNSSSWSINSGISSMSIGDLTKSSDNVGPSYAPRTKNYPRLVNMLTTASMDERESETTVNNEHAVATSPSNGAHNVDSHIVNQSKPVMAGQRHRSRLQRQDAVVKTLGGVESVSTSTCVEPSIPVQPIVYSPVSTSMAVDTNSANTFYVPVQRYESNFTLPVNVACIPCGPSPAAVEYQQYHSNGGTPKNYSSGPVSVASESYTYNQPAGMYQQSPMVDDNMTVGALSYSHSSSNGSESNFNPSLNSFSTTSFNANLSYNNSGYFYTNANNSMSQSNFSNGSGSNGTGSVSFNQNSMIQATSTNTLTYLSEIKGEKNIYKEKTKSPRYVGRNNYRCGKCGQPKVNHVCEVVDTLITGVEVQTAQPIYDHINKKAFNGERVLTISKRKNLMEEFDYDEHHNRYNITQPRRDIFAKRLALQQQQQYQLQQFRASMGLYSIDTTSPTNAYTQQQLAMYQELLARSRSGSTLFSSSYSTPSSSTQVTPTAAAAVAAMSLNR